MTLPSATTIVAVYAVILATATSVSGIRERQRRLKVTLSPWKKDPFCGPTRVQVTASDPAELIGEDRLGRLRDLQKNRPATSPGPLPSLNLKRVDCGT